MNSRPIIFSLLILLTGYYVVNAQSVEFSKYNFPNHREELSEALSQIKEGDRYYQQGPGVYHLAIAAYNKAYTFNPKNALLNYKIGRCYLNDNDKTEAIKYFERAIEISPTYHEHAGENLTKARMASQHRQ